MASEDAWLREQILDAALELAAQQSWEAVRLHQVAGRLGIGLDTLRREFAEKEDLVDAFFDRADAAMLESLQSPDFAALSPRQRLRWLILAWLDALAPFRRTVREMIVGKLEPGHLHVQIPGLLRVSRTVQWIREAAGLQATFLRRALEETALTTIYLATFTRWLNDDSPDAVRTRSFLDRCLLLAEGVAERLESRRGSFRSGRDATVGPVPDHEVPGEPGNDQESPGR